MELARGDLLARAALAAEEHRGHRGRGLAEAAHRVEHRGRGAHDGTVLAGRRLGRLVGRHRRARERLADREEHLVAIEGLGEEVRRARLHRLDRERHRPMRGEEDDGHVAVLALHLGEQLHAVHAGHAHVRHDHIDAAGRERRERLRAGADVARLVPCLRDQRREHHADRAVVVHDEHTRTRGSVHGARW